MLFLDIAAPKTTLEKKYDDVQINFLPYYILAICSRINFRNKNVWPNRVEMTFIREQEMQKIYKVFLMERSNAR